MNPLFIEDYKAYYNEDWSLRGWIRLLVSYPERIIYIGRKAQLTKIEGARKFLQLLLKFHGYNRGVEIHNFENIGPGLALIHCFNITISSDTIIGKNCTLMKGCTLGSIRGGNKQGSPQIGNHVVVCMNATVVGNIKVGNDVMIAANSFVNFDVPSHSVVIGNPGVIHHKVGATLYYECIEKN